MKRYSTWIGFLSNKSKTITFMKKIIYGFLFLLIVFIINLVVYYTNADYQNFIKSIKYDETAQKTDIDNVFFTDEEPQKQTECICENNTNLEQKNENEDIFTSTENIESQNLQDLINSELQESYSGVINETLELFWSGNLILKQYSWDYKIFWLTDEYPKKYVTYLNKKYEIYMFLEDNYDNLYNLFTYLWNELSFEVNRTNSFWNRSFFINTPDKNTVNIVIKHSNKLFWIKMDKKYYNEIKNILNKL